MSLRTISPEELKTIIDQHAAYLRNEVSGKHADLSRANLSGADLSRANLSRANLSGADLSRANLSGADLSRANLSRANLSGAYLSGAYLSGAYLSGAYLFGANLSGANLSGANLFGANLSGANLSDAKNAELAIAQTRVAPPEGEIIGWKKCYGEVIVKLRVPPDARRCNAFGRKCRAEFVDVIQVIGATTGVSNRYQKTEYTAGNRVTCDHWGEDFTQECSGGIHFFITRAEAEAY